MRVLIYSPGPPSRSDALLRQFAAFIQESGHGIGWRYFGAYSEYEPADVVVTIGWNHAINLIHSDQSRNAKPSISISDGFVRRGWAPGAFFAATRNGLHAYGDQINSMPGDRWAALGVKLRPWTDNKNGHILVAHQHTPAYNNHDRQPWFHETIRLIKNRTDRQIIVRPHPRDRKRNALPPGGLISNRSFREDLESAWAVVTYDSNMAVDALMYGVPVFTAGKTKADPLACRDIELINDPPKPDRQQWAHDLAYAQFNVNELRAGLPWIHLIGGAPSGLAHCVKTPATEADYEYAETWESLEDSLTDWNVKDGQTPAQVLKEISNPKIADAVKQRRSKFINMSPAELVTFLIDRGIRANEDEAKELLIGRAIHATL